MMTPALNGIGLGFLGAWWRYLVLVLGGQSIFFLLAPVLVFVLQYGWTPESRSFAWNTIDDLPYAIVATLFTLPYTLLFVSMILAVLGILRWLRIGRVVIVPAIGLLSALLSAGPSLYIDSILFGFLSALLYPRFYVPAALGIVYGAWLVCGSFYPEALNGEKNGPGGI